MQPLGVAVIGAGYWGPNLIRNFQSTTDFRLHLVCDLDPDRAARAVGPYSTVDTTTALDRVLEDPRIDAVAVATPAGTHLAVALECLDAGKHVLIEKPLAASYSEGEKLVSAAAERDLVLMCDHTFCYTPTVRRIRELVRGQELGDLQYLDSVRINLGLVQSDIDVVWDLAPHDLSILDFILPADCSPLGVAAHGADPIGAGRACIAYLTLPLANGAIAHVHVNWLSPTKIRTIVVGGSRRTLVWDDVNPSQRLSVYDRGVDMAWDAAAETRRDALISYRTGDMVAPALPEQEALGAVVREFAGAIRERRPALTDGMSGLRVLGILEAASRSMERNGALVPLGESSA